MTTQAPSRGPLEANLRWAFRWTFWFATFYSGFVVLRAILQGSTWFPKYKLSLWAVIGGYYAAAFFAGITLALLRPLGNSRLGAYILGAIIGYVVYLSIGVLVEPTLAVLWIAAIPALFTGGIGVVFYDQPDAGSLYSGGMPKSRIAIYAIVLAAAAVLLWLDIHYHIINK